ncbi:MAG TPA: Mrp/NBP35 family ATP-binding protein [Firmicutes bacterium]|nr:Mrp/NBP35 family ATP-binding protein [Bacillota bacterium]
MSESCNHDCSSCSQNCDERSLIEQTNEFSHVKKVIGVVSGKGGVGKSLVTSMLAVLMNRKGYQTAILDADITGPSIPKMFGIQQRAKGSEQGIFPERTANDIRVMSINLLLDQADSPVIWRGPIIAGTVKQFWTDVIWGDVDYMFIDMPPGTGDVPLTVFQSIPVDGIVIVTSPQELVSLIVKKAYNMAQMMNIPVLGIVENMSYVECPDCGKKIKLFGESNIEETCRQLSIPFLGEIPIDPQLTALSDAGEFERMICTALDSAADTIEENLPCQAD